MAKTIRIDQSYIYDSTSCCLLFHINFATHCIGSTRSAFPTTLCRVRGQHNQAQWSCRTNQINCRTRLLISSLVQPEAQARSCSPADPTYLGRHTRRQVEKINYEKRPLSVKLSLVQALMNPKDPFFVPDRVTVQTTAFNHELIHPLAAVFSS